MASVIEKEKQLKRQIENLYLSPETQQAILRMIDELADALHMAGWKEGYSDGLDTGYGDGYGDGFSEGMESREDS